MIWIAALAALAAIGIAWGLRDHYRAKRARKCPGCGTRDLRKTGQNSGGIKWSCTRCQVPLFEPFSVSHPKDFPGPMTTEQYKAYCSRSDLPAARLVNRS
ncbi:MAG TPA: hypothetical protein VGM39_05530 [Kofleriaceae bacterium]